MPKRLRIGLAAALILIGIFLNFKICSYDFGNWEFEKHQSDFQTVADVLAADFESLNEESRIYNGENDKFDKTFERIENFRPYVFDCVEVNSEQMVFVYGIGLEYIIHTYDGKKPDYSFLAGLDFYTGKLSDGWYVAKLR